MLWGCFFVTRTGRVVRTEGKDGYRKKMLSQIVQVLKLEKRFSFFQLKNNQKHTAKKAQDGLQENLVNVQVCHSQNLSLTPIQHLGKKKK